MQKTSSLAVKYIGSTSKQSIPAAFQAATNKASETIEKKYPKVQDAKIQGAQPHKSSKDPNDPKQVITISYHTAKGTRVTSVHVHDDNTFVEFPSRNAGKGK
ncbi:uncharacterized protein RHO25_007083 [Cercospora beticola]|uniref:Uncharacterized protein n=1 Tax=Cercospora beticola TaxID=122368 RepID=A0ABZ0NS97_CERBT|nr:hypothetical protein RHO25_007083 [Cercospora beticola]CAK1362661.1 unnamed protein product [Cercospora beticola]